jgi:hypothetical protein
MPKICGKRPSPMLVKSLGACVGRKASHEITVRNAPGGARYRRVVRHGDGREEVNFEQVGGRGTMEADATVVADELRRLPSTQARAYNVETNQELKAVRGVKAKVRIEGRAGSGGGTELHMTHDGREAVGVTPQPRKEVYDEVIRDSRERNQSGVDQVELDLKSVKVPVPHGDMTATDIPPVAWRPGVGAIKRFKAVRAKYGAKAVRRTVARPLDKLEHDTAAHHGDARPAYVVESHHGDTGHTVRYPGRQHDPEQARELALLWGMADERLGHEVEVDDEISKRLKSVRAKVKAHANIYTDSQDGSGHVELRHATDNFNRQTLPDGTPNPDYNYQHDPNRSHPVTRMPRAEAESRLTLGGTGMVDPGRGPGDEIYRLDHRTNEERDRAEDQAVAEQMASAQLPPEYDPHYNKALREAYAFLKSIEDAQSLSQEQRMEAYHHHMVLGGKAYVWRSTPAGVNFPGETIADEAGEELPLDQVYANEGAYGLPRRDPGDITRSTDASTSWVNDEDIGTEAESKYPHIYGTDGLDLPEYDPNQDKALRENGKWNTPPSDVNLEFEFEDGEDGSDLTSQDYEPSQVLELDDPDFEVKALSECLKWLSAEKAYGLPHREAVKSLLSRVKAVHPGYVNPPPRIGDRAVVTHHEDWEGQPNIHGTINALSDIEFMPYVVGDDYDPPGSGDTVFPTSDLRTLRREENGKSVYPGYDDLPDQPEKWTEADDAVHNYSMDDIAADLADDANVQEVEDADGDILFDEIDPAGQERAARIARERSRAYPTVTHYPIYAMYDAPEPRPAKPLTAERKLKSIRAKYSRRR